MRTQPRKRPTDSQTLSGAWRMSGTSKVGEGSQMRITKAMERQSSPETSRQFSKPTYARVPPRDILKRACAASYRKDEASSVRQSESRWPPRSRHALRATASARD